LAPRFSTTPVTRGRLQFLHSIATSSLQYHGEFKVLLLLIIFGGLSDSDEHKALYRPTSTSLELSVVRYHLYLMSPYFSSDSLLTSRGRTRLPFGERCTQSGRRSQSLLFISSSLWLCASPPNIINNNRTLNSIHNKNNKLS